MSRFKSVTPIMLYIDSKDLLALKMFAKTNRTTMSQVARDGIRMRMIGSQNPYDKGFNDGLMIAMDLTKKSKGGQMMFPSGKSFAETVCEEIEKHLRKPNGRHNGSVDERDSTDTTDGEPSSTVN